MDQKVWNAPWKYRKSTSTSIILDIAKGPDPKKDYYNSNDYYIIELDQYNSQTTTYKQYYLNMYTYNSTILHFLYSNGGSYYDQYLDLYMQKSAYNQGQTKQGSTYYSRASFRPKVSFKEES